MESYFQQHCKTLQQNPILALLNIGFHRRYFSYEFYEIFQNSYLRNTSGRLPFHLTFQKMVAVKLECRAWHKRSDPWRSRGTSRCRMPDLFCKTTPTENYSTQIHAYISTQDKALTCLAKRSKAERALLILFAGLASILTIKKLAKNLRLLTSFTSFWSFYC